jgi:hypothetical protein
MNKTIRKNHEYYWSAIIDDEPEKTNSEGSLRVLKEMGDISVKPGWSNQSRLEHTKIG